MALFGLVGPQFSRDPEALSSYARRAAAREDARVSWKASSGCCFASSIHSEGGVTVALQGEPRLSGAPRAAAEAWAPAKAVCAAYLERGEGCLASLLGTFALAIIDERDARTLLAIDRMGIERLAFRVLPDGIVFGTSAEAVARVPRAPAELSHQALFDFLLLHMVPSPGTVFRDVHKLRPATLAVFQGGRMRISRYWRPAFVERGGASFPELRNELHAALESAVRDHRPDECTGAFLSGGLDSSTVTGVLGKVTGTPPKSFSIGFGVESYDELRYARIASRHFGCQAHEYDVTPEDVVDAFPRIASAYDEPFGNSSAVPTYFCARLAAGSGVTHLLAGDGGDELFGGNERYAKQHVIETYHRIPRPLRRWAIEPLARRIPRDGAPVPLGKLRSYVEQALVPLPDRLEYWNLVYQADASRMLDPEFVGSIDTEAPMRLLREVYESAPCKSVLNKLLYYDWHFTLADDDLRKVGTMCRLAGVRVSYPMIDARVVDLSTRVPPSMKMRRFELRSFYKQAMRGFLAPATLAKQKHGFGLPFGVWLKSHARLGELIYSHLADLKSRRLIRPAFLDELIEQHRLGHPSYFGYAIWDLAMLEAWLQAHTSPALIRPAAVV